MTHAYLLRTAVLTFIVVTLILFGLDTFLQTPIAPMGIVSFEFAGNYSNAQAILNAWDEHAKAAAGISLGIDFLYLASYGLIGYLALRASTKQSKKFTLIVSLWLFPLAALCDIVENTALILLLLGKSNPFLPILAYAFAAAKFTLLGIGAIVLIRYGTKHLIQCQPE